MRRSTDRGALRALTLLRGVQRWCRRSTASCSRCGSSVRRWLRRTLSRSARDATRPVRYRASYFSALRRLIPACAARAFSGSPSLRWRRIRRSRLIGVSRALRRLCMGGEVLGRAVTPRPWRPHTQSSAEQPGGTTQLGAGPQRTSPQPMLTASARDPGSDFESTPRLEACSARTAST